MKYIVQMSNYLISGENPEEIRDYHFLNKAFGVTCNIFFEKDWNSDEFFKALKTCKTIDRMTFWGLFDSLWDAKKKVEWAKESIKVARETDFKDLEDNAARILKSAVYNLKIAASVLGAEYDE